MIGNGLDLANYQWPLTPDLCASWYAQGVRYVIVGCQRPDISRQQIPMLRAAGIEVIGTYAYLYWGYDVGSEVQNAIDIALEFDIHGPPWAPADVWLDCENGGELPGVGVDTRHPQLEACVAQVRAAGLRPGIYTGAPFWEDAMGNSPEFAALPLWHAAYWYDLHFVTKVAYGGWTRPCIHQVTASGNLMNGPGGSLVAVPPLSGMNVDYDQFFEEEETMTDEEIKQLVTDTIAAEFRDFTTAYFTGGFTKPDGTPLPVSPEVAAAIATIAKTTASGIPAHAHSFGPTTTGGVA